MLRRDSPWWERAAVSYTFGIGEDPLKVLVSDLVINAPVEASAAKLHFTVRSWHKVEGCMTALIHAEHPHALEWSYIGYRGLGYETSPDHVANVVRLVTGKQRSSPQ